MTEVRAHSFDVFDTCLVRRWARPVDVLEAAARRVVADDALGREELVSDLVRARQAAERRAMERRGVEAVELDAIYADGDAIAALGVDPATLHAAELELERTEIRPVRAALERVNAARAAGLRVLFISDMYLPAGEIRERLADHGFWAPDDRLYVSGELGVSKFTGRLFEHVLREEGLAPHELVHHGDDAITDDAAPARLGVGVRPLPLAALSRFEASVVEHSAIPRAVRARLAGVMRAARVRTARNSDAEAAYSTVTAGAAAPLFGAFAAWALRTARAEGLERLYFVSRDGQILLRAAQELRGDGDPELRYLYGSRQAWLPAGVESLDPHELKWLLEPAHALRTPRTLLARLGVAPEAAGSPLRAAGLRFDERLDADGLQRFWTALESARDPVRAEVAAARANVQGYLRQEGLYAPGRWAIVDLGWRLTAQRALRRVLAATGDEHRLLGLYLGVGANRVPLQESGPFRAFITQDDEWTDDVRAAEAWIFANTPTIEQVFAMADHGSCTGYRRVGGRFEPELRAYTDDPARAAYREQLHSAVACFAREAVDTGLLDEHLASVRASALLTGRLAIARPTRAEAAALGRLHVSDDQNETRVRELAAPLTTAALIRILASRAGLPVTRDFATDHVWRPGAEALASPGVRSALAAMRRGESQAREVRAAVRRSRIVYRASTLARQTRT
jgi:FMN phosphatase YigB (HAD superfamily)